jgi:BioD-like phosphotransacetylase family protein
MNISAIITSNAEEEADLALDFSSFLLRYHRDLEYGDFSDDSFVQQKIKRAETYRSWADIEDLANGFETLSTNFENH